MKVVKRPLFTIAEIHISVEDGARPWQILLRDPGRYDRNGFSVAFGSADRLRQHAILEADWLALDGVAGKISNARMWIQKKLTLKPRPRGFHLVTQEIVAQLPELAGVGTGLVHFFLLHTSASLSLNENADPSVRHDFESYFNRAVPEKAAYFTHTLEGPDDMPAHIKSSLLGAGVMLPVSAGRLLVGTWQGLYLGEHRDRAGARSLVATLNGE